MFVLDVSLKNGFIKICKTFNRIKKLFQIFTFFLFILDISLKYGFIKIRKAFNRMQKR